MGTSDKFHHDDEHEDVAFVLVGEDMETEVKTQLDPPQNNLRWRFAAAVTLIIVVVVVLVAVLVSNGGNGESKPSAPPVKLLWLSDLHLDPYYNGTLSHKCGCNNLQYRRTRTNMSDGECAGEAEHVNMYSKPGCDSSLALVHSMLADAAKTVPDPGLIIITGDYTRHNTKYLVGYEQATILNAIQDISTLVQSYFPSSAALHLPSDEATSPSATGVVLGNNDFSPDYGTSSPEWLLQVHKVALSSEWTKEQTAEFLQGGFSLFMLGDSIAVINMNTVIYSVNYNKSNPNPPADPHLQFLWLNRTLEELRSAGVRAFICAHIPPTLDSYARSPMWRDQYVSRYFSIVKAHSSVVIAQLFGHVHKDEFRVLIEDDLPADFPPMLLAGALEAHFSNNPSYKVLHFNFEELRLIDYVLRAGDLYGADGGRELKWSDLYSFQNLYGQSELSNRALKQILDGMWTDGNQLDKSWSQYWSNRAAGFFNLGNIPPISWYAKPNVKAANGVTTAEGQMVHQLCVVQSFTTSQYKACLKAHPAM